MKKLIYGGLFLALIGIGLVGCKKELIPQNPLQNSSNEFKVSTDGKMLIFETIEDFERAIKGESDSEHTRLLEIVKTMKIDNYFSDVQPKSWEEDMNEMDEFFGQLLNKDGAIQIGEHIFKIDLENEKVFVLNAKDKDEDYSDLIHGNTSNKNIQVFSTDDDVLDLIIDGVQEKACDGAAQFNHTGNKHYDGFIGGEYVQFQARYLKLGIYFSVRIKGHYYGYGLANPELTFEIRSDSPNYKAMRMRRKPCNSGSTTYHTGGIRNFSNSGIWSGVNGDYYKMWKGYEGTRALNGYRIWIKGYINGKVADKTWIGREVNSNF